jgi:hypothetical protein
VPGRATLGAVSAEPHPPDLSWARSGAMTLTGHADGPPVLAPAPLAAWADREAERLRARAPSAVVDGGALLGERAALRGLVRRGRTAPGGACRLTRARDGWLAVNLARSDDSALLPAWLETPRPGVLADEIATRDVGTLVERARLLGLAVAPAGQTGRAATPPHRARLRGPRRAPAPQRPPRVVDLSALWAGPLCGQLLGLAGASVAKVECRSRPDGARAGSPEFYDLLNAGKASVALDFRAETDRGRLLRLVRSADIVIESSRPRALRQLGVDAEACVREHGTTWVSITGYGRGAPEEDWVAFGDDAAAAAGLCAAARDAGGPLFCGDAIADPLAGLHAAAAALEIWQAGDCALLDVSLRGVVAHALGERSSAGTGRVTAAGGGTEGHDADPGTTGWVVRVGERTEPVRPPRARTATGRARPLGADTAAVLASADGSLRAPA